MSAAEGQARHTGRFGRFATLVGIVLLVCVLLLLTTWATLAIHYSNLPGQGLRTGAAALFALGTSAAYLLLSRRGRTTLWFAAVFALVLVWWLTISPSHDREWAIDVAVLPRATIDGDRVTVHDVRNFDYRAVDDFTVRYDDRTYDTSQLEGIDISLCYWDGNRHIAHTIVSFNFAVGEPLALSIETRKEKTEGYSTVAGLFKQFELIYVLGDERDLLRLRTNYRGEEVYLYPLKYTREQARKVFFNLIHKVNELAERPEWYNALEFNCTTALIPLTEGARIRPFAFDIRMLLNGHLDEMGYERKEIPADASDGLPFEEMRAAHRISQLAQRYDDAADFSRRIRAGLPARSR